MIRMTFHQTNCDLNNKKVYKFLKIANLFDKPRNWFALVKQVRNQSLLHWKPNTRRNGFQLILKFKMNNWHN